VKTQQVPFYLTAIVLAFNDKWSWSYSTAQVQRRTRSHPQNRVRQNNSLKGGMVPILIVGLHPMIGGAKTCD